LTSAGAIGTSDHACWRYSSDAERADAASAWLADGLRLGQRSLYVADAPPAGLLADLAAVPGLPAAVESGALIVMSSSAVYDLSAPIDATAQLALYAAVVDQAVADGYRGVRVAADITPLVLDPARRPAHLHWEQVADRYMTEHPLAPLCMYDARRVKGLSAIASVHPLQGPDEPVFGLYGDGPHRAALAGEVDGLVADVLAEILICLPETDEVLDVGGLSFLDARGAWTLHSELTRRRGLGHHVLLTGASRALRRVWDICGLDQSLFLAA
jgi:anti-anti-sigma factor